MIQKTVAVILAGGLARRMNGVEKGLQLLNGKPLISYILERISPQVEAIWLNINRNQAEYQHIYPNLATFSDELQDFQGPLSGILSAFSYIQAENILFVPCDTPFLPENLYAKLHTALTINQAHISYAHNGERPQPTCVLINRAVVPALKAYLASGERKLLSFFQQQKSVAVDFSKQAAAFTNFNSLEELNNYTPLPQKPKLLGITGYSGTGKTTLLEKLIPELTCRGLKVGLIKHSHHDVEIDKAGKDSYRLRQAGANPTMLVSDRRWALMKETSQAVSFEAIFANFAKQDVDLVLVEGFKDEPIAKIQLHRQGLEKPLPEEDSYTLATATDYPLERKNLLNINDIEQIATFICGLL